MTTATKHSPGPWHVRPNGADSSPFDIDDVRGRQIGAAIFGPTNGVEEARANAHLMAEAPELLAVASRALGYFRWMAAQDSDFTPDPAWLLALETAIARATGQEVTA